MTKSTIDLLSTVEAAALLRVHPKTLRRYVAEGRIGSHRPSTAKLQFTRAHIDEYLASCEVPAARPKAKPTRSPRYAGR